MIKTWNFIIIEAGMGYHVVGKSTIDGAERIVVVLCYDEGQICRGLEVL
jgi:hypothetical protein